MPQSLGGLDSRRSSGRNQRLHGDWLLRSSLPAYPLGFANEFSGVEHAAAVEAAHPGVVSANIFGGGYRNWYYQPQEEQLLERINTGGCVLLQGEASTVGLVPDFRTEPIFVPDVHEYHGQEGLFRLLPPGEAGR